MFSDDKNYIAMLAVPIILSWIFSFAGTADDRSITDRNRSEVLSAEEVRDTEVRRNVEYRGNSAVEASLSELVFSLNSDARQKAVKAVEDNDFQAFIASVKGTIFSEIMTKDAFYVLVDTYKDSRYS